MHRYVASVHLIRESERESPGLSGPVCVCVCVCVSCWRSLRVMACSRIVMPLFFLVLSIYSFIFTCIFIIILLFLLYDIIYCIYICVIVV